MTKKIKVFVRGSFILLYRLYRLLFRDNHRSVLLYSFSGKYSDNPRAISEKIHEIDPSIRLIWPICNIADKKDTLPDYIFAIDYNKPIERWKAYANARVIIGNEPLPIIPKSKKQLFIQTWHGDRGFKKCLKESEHVACDKLLEEIEGMCDYAVSGSTYGEGVYRRAFGFKGDLIKMGCPRNDCLINNNIDKNNQIRAKLKINLNEKVLLYAPTLRRRCVADRATQEIQDIDFKRTIDCLNKKYLTTKWVLVIRAHPATLGLKIDPQLNAIDASDYEDMADLLSISDMLITDYSSSAGDFALTGKPIVLFQSDREDFMKIDRTFYFDIDKSPFWVANSQDELERIINNLSDDLARQNCHDILKFYGAYETGEAAECIAKVAVEWCSK